MSDGTDKSQFVNIENYLRAENSSWADETEEDHERESKPRAWAVPSVVDEAPNLYEIQAEEEKAAAEASSRAAAEAAKRPYRAPQKSHISSGFDNSERHYESRPFERPPREKQPIPTEPPFTAFIGNLAYDVSEEDIMDYFGELGVVSIRLLKDGATGKPRGYGYIEFETADGLSKGLLANDNKLKGRPMNLDVAKPQQASSNSWGSSGNRDRNSSRPAFKQDTTWGPSPGGSFKDRMSFNRNPPPSSERPKLNINPPKPISPRDPIKSKPSVESIFGTNINDDEVKKMNKLSEERIKREMEKEQKREQEKKDREKRVTTPRSPGRGDNQPEDRFNSSWRGSNAGKGSTTVKQPYNMNFARQDEPSKPTGRVTQKPLVDSDGFRGQTSRPAGHNRGWENQGSTRSDTQKNSNPKEIQNKFESLHMGGDEE